MKVFAGLVITALFAFARPSRSSHFPPSKPLYSLNHTVSFPSSGHHGGPDSEHCHCGAFATTHDGLVELDSFPHEHVPECSEVLECKTVCQTSWENEMGSGNLEGSRPDGITVGQHFCNNLAEDGITTFGPHKVYGYSSICHGPLLYDNRESQQHLCCTNSVYKPCPEDTHIH